MDQIYKARHSYRDVGLFSISKSWSQNKTTGSEMWFEELEEVKIFPLC